MSNQFIYLYTTAYSSPSDAATSTAIAAVATISAGVTGNIVVETSTRDVASTTGDVASITAGVAGNRVVEMLAPAVKTRKTVTLFVCTVRRGLVKSKTPVSFSFSFDSGGRDLA